LTRKAFRDRTAVAGTVFIGKALVARVSSIAAFTTSNGLDLADSDVVGSAGWVASNLILDAELFGNAVLCSAVPTLKLLCSKVLMVGLLFDLMLAPAMQRMMVRREASQVVNRGPTGFI
jgi:hypothetical protein